MPLTSSIRSTQGVPTRPIRAAILLGHAGDADASYGITGVERVVQQLLEGFAGTVIEPYLVYPGQGRLGEIFTKHSRALLARQPERRYDGRFLKDLSIFLQEHQIDVVMSIGMRQDFHAALVCRKLHLPHVIHRPVALADETMPWLRRAFYGIMDTWALRQSREVIACSEASALRMRQTQALSSRRVVVVPNGVDFPEVSPEERRAARARLGISADGLMIVGVGQLIRRKSFHLLVDAIAQTQTQSEHRLECVLLGEGPERQTLEESAQRQGVALQLLGFVDHPEQIVAAADISVLPSLAEGMPLVVLEAMALGIPTIATNVAGTPEVIQDGVCGVLIPPNDTRALATAIRRLAEDDPLRAQLGVAGRKRTRSTFSLQAMIDGFIASLQRNSRITDRSNGEEPV